MSDGPAAAWAVEQIERVRDDPAGRMALLSRTYERLCRARFVAYRREERRENAVRVLWATPARASASR